MIAKNSILLDAIQRHKLVVVVDLPISCSRSGELSKESLTNELKKRLQVEGNLSFEQIIDLGLKKQGKETFIVTLNRILNQPGNKTPMYYKLFEKIGVKYIVDTHYSPLFRNEITDAGMSSNYSFYSRDDDFSFDEYKQIIISLFGDTEYSKEKLIISQNEFNGFFNNMNHLSSSLLSIFKSTILFIDFDPNSGRFKCIYDLICQKNGKYPIEAFLISTTEASQLSYGINENLIVINADANEYLEAIANQLSTTTRNIDIDINDMIDLPPVPYKYLHSYGRNDYAIFFGRNKEVSELCLRIRGARQIAMLTSLSGYGKTSMINAGIIPALTKTNDYDIFYIRAGSNPWESMVKEVFNDYPDTFEINKKDIVTLSDKRYQLIIIDQFEECFVNSSEETIKQIDDNMKSFLNYFPTITLLLVIRQDFFTYLTKFKFLDDAQINSTYNLEPLSQMNAKDSIQKPAELYNFSYENGLVEQIIKDLSTNEEGNKFFIEPSQLQIVCYFLYQELQNKQQTIITFEIYDELGKAGGILDNYIDESLKIYTESRQRLGKDILKCFVSSKDTRIPKSVQEIFAELQSSDKCEGIHLESEIKFMLDKLVNARLLRTRTIDEREQVFELTHEYIIRKINEWMDTETLKFKEITELFRVEFRKWSLHYKTIMPENLYEEVWKYRNKINFTVYEKSYVLLCVISYLNRNNEEIRYWINQNRGNDSCEKDLIYAMETFKGHKRILAGVLLTILCPSNDIMEQVSNNLSKNINPYLSIVESEISTLGELIDENFLKKMYGYLNQNRKSNMCAIPSAMNVRLGISIRKRNDIIKKHGIENRMKPFFPDTERIVNFNMFRIDIYTVTNRMFAEYDENHHYNEEQADYPVVGINYEQAKAYAHWWGKDLPTEDEWEYAARGTDFRDFPWGNDWDYEQEKTKPESEKLCNTSLTGTDGARSAKEYPNGVSPFGCFNMSGNVWEWTKSVVPNDSARLYVKGGSWSRMGIMPWTWYRYTSSQESGQQNISFRCVLRGES